MAIFPKKISKEAVLYFGNDGGKKRCGRCMMFLEDIDRCSIHGEDVVTRSNYVCGLYLNGEPMDSEEHPPMKLITPKESGLTNTTSNGTHCGNCIHADEDVEVCSIVAGEIEYLGCCNAWENPELVEK